GGAARRPPAAARALRNGQAPGPARRQERRPPKPGSAERGRSEVGQGSQRGPGARPAALAHADGLRLVHREALLVVDGVEEPLQLPRYALVERIAGDRLVVKDAQRFDLRLQIA